MAIKNHHEKTLAMYVLEGQDVEYDVIVYPSDVHDAEAIAEYADVPAGNVYKTLVALTDDPRRKPLLIMLASNTTLDLKKVAKAVGVKKVRMARHADAEDMTGLQVGGISALALLNKGFDIYIDEWAQVLDFILVSAGQRGMNLRLHPDDLIRVTEAITIDASRED